jgi:hypothetical protein
MPKTLTFLFAAFLICATQAATYRTPRPSTSGFGNILSSSVQIDVTDNYIVGFPTNALLSAITSVDGSTSGTSTEWSYIDSPGVVTFTPSTGTNVTAAFSAVGSYTIQVTGRKGTYYSTNTFKVFVIEPAIQPPPIDPPPPPPMNIAPVVVITAPTNGATFTAPISLTMEATADDNGGQVTSVLFRDNGQDVLTVSNAPYAAELPLMTPGSHVLDAIATDNAGATTMVSVAISVLRLPNVPPTIVITSPTNTQQFAAAASVSIAATASDTEGTVVSVSFFHDETLIGTDTNAPFALTWTPGAAGLYQITAQATDDEGLVGASGAVTIDVLPLPVVPNVLPVVAITSPTNTQTFIAPATLAITASAFDPDGTIASVRFYNAETLISTDTTSPYTAQIASAAAGNYPIHAVALDNSGEISTSIAINALVVPNSVPTVTLTAPTNGLSFLTPVTIPLAATATDSDGTIVSVKFYNGGTLLATDTSSPFTHSIPSAAAGNYSFTAVATDDRGDTNSSGAVTINVSAPAVNILPVVAITSPADATVYIAPATINITATATDADGTIANVKFYNGSTLLGTDTSSPFTGSAAAVPAGTYAIRAEATDNSGAIVSSATINAIVNNNAVPVVTVTLPTNNTPFIAPATFALAATATDADGTIVSVRFYHEATQLGATELSAPYDGFAVSVPVGTYTIRAEATDNLGGVGVSATINAIVTAANQFPAVAFTTPTNGATFTAPVTFNLVASATDPDGTIASVLFIDNGSTLSTDTSSPYSVSITPSVGTHLATAKATDNLGSNTTTSVSYTVLPVPNVAPAVTLTAPAAGTSFNAGEDIVLAATATDSDGTITKVEFFEGGNLINTDPLTPFGVLWFDVPRGNYSLTAVATDNSGATRASATVLISVVDAAVPLLVNAGSDFTVTLPATGSLSTATATGNAISQVTWSKVTGAGTVSFANANHTNTTATFSVSGSYVLQLRATTAQATNTDTVVVTVLPASQPTFPTNSLPIEIAGHQGITEVVTVGLTDIAPGDSYKFSMTYHHTLHSTNGFKVQFNNGPTINVNDVTFPPAQREAAFGGHFGGSSVIRCTNSGISGSILLNNALNTVRFIFSDTNSSPAAIRVLAFNFQHAGTNLIPTTKFSTEDPANWAPIYTNATLIATGRGIWYGTNLTGFQSDGTFASIRAKCTDCHAQDGRDLKYYNYSNKSIVERSKFHGLTQLQGEYVASYIRSLNVPSPGRPWNPPYQPGPGLDTNVLSAWAAGAGIGAVLDNDQLTISDIFGTVVTNTVITLTNNANPRQVRIAMQLPDWNHWLPSIHPLDAFGPAAFINSGSKLLTQYGGGTNGAAVGTQYLRNTLVRGSAASLANSKDILGPWILEQTSESSPYQLSISPKASRDPIGPGRKAYAAALWQVTKMWELHNEFELQNLAGANIVRPNYAAIYDAEYTASKTTYDNLAASSNELDLYSTIHQMMATTSMWEATSNLLYLNRALTWAETIISKATITDSNGKLNWPGAWASPYSATPIATELSTYQGTAELTRLARVILTTPSLSAFNTRATAIYNHIKTHVVNNILITRNGQAFMDTLLSRTNNGMSDKPALMLRNILNLSQCSTALGNSDNVTYAWPALVAHYASGMKDHFGTLARFVPHAGGLLWDKGFGLESPYTSIDTEHANRVPVALIELYRAGVTFDKSYLDGITSLLNSQIWDKSLTLPTSPRFVNFADGQNTAFRSYGPYLNGVVAYGWNWLAEWSPTTFAAMDKLLTKVNTTTGDRNDNAFYRIGLSAELARCATRLPNGAGIFSLAAEPRTQYTKRVYFDASPNILGLGLTTHGINNGSLQTHRYFSQAWYQVQLLIDAGNRSPDIFYSTSQAPVDWPYVEGILKDLQNLTPTNFALGGLFTLWKVKEIQANAYTYGPDRWNNGGWNPHTTTNPDSFVDSDFNPFWSNTPNATRKLITEACMRNWLYETERWPVALYYAGTSPLTTAAYIPVDNRDGGHFGDSIVSMFTPRNGKFYINNLGSGTGLAVDRNLQIAILNRCKLIWPAKNWTSLYPP